VSTEYELLGESIADVMFGSASAGQPVYALADSQALREILAVAGVAGDDHAALARVVRSRLHVDDAGVAPFRALVEATKHHAGQPLETPPALPLLVLLAHAAEQMQADEDLAPHNYYSRLHRLLRVPTDSYGRVESDYRRCAELLWGSLNVWLEAWEGERGIPTAHQIGGHAFIGLPMSQAVVRQHDRGGLHELFALEGLTSGLRISPADMVAAMDPYASVTPSPLSSHLLRLWRMATARERIVEAACIELEAWDGSGIDAMASVRQAATTRLLAFVRTFPRKSVEFNLMLPYRSDAPSIATFKLLEGHITVPTVSGPGGSTRLSGVEGVSAASLVGERLAGEFGDDSGRPFARSPKRVVALRWDDLQGAFVEIERIALGEDGVVLVRSDARHRVEEHLSAHARPGWRELTDLPTLPDGWLMYKNVEVVSSPDGQAHFDLLPLVPRALTSLTLHGGFTLPGLLRKWSTLEPPEVVGLAAGASSVEVRVYRGLRADDDQLVTQASEASELVVLSLSDSMLIDGEYFVAMFVDSASRPASTALLRLRSANTPQFRVEDVDIRLVYSPESGLGWPLRAGPANWPSFVNGARISGLRPSSTRPANPMHEFFPRQRLFASISTARVQVGIPMSDDSCLVTGMHHFRGPRVEPGARSARSVEWECEDCGLVRRFAGTASAAKRREVSEIQPGPPVGIPPVSQSGKPDFEVAFDALNHVGTGSFGVFERVAAQVEGSGLFADSFLRRLEVVGHLDVARDDNFRVNEWAVNSSTLVPIGKGRWVLIGSRSTRLLATLAELLGTEAEMVIGVDAELARVEVVGVLPDSGLSELGIEVLKASSAAAIAAAQPYLSDLAPSLKRTVVPFFRTAEFWETSSASWQPAGSLLRPGAYRLKDFGSAYVVRSAEDVEAGTIGLGNAQLVKHIANLWAGDPLIGYHSLSGSVVTPLGADLPALYGRALALNSGRAPHAIEKHRMLQYPAVPREIAQVVFDRMSQ
jgi:hypothetical protein